MFRLFGMCLEVSCKVPVPNTLRPYGYENNKILEVPMLHHDDCLNIKTRVSDSSFQQFYDLDKSDKQQYYYGIWIIITGLFLYSVFLAYNTYFSKRISNKSCLVFLNFRRFDCRMVAVVPCHVVSHVRFCTSVLLFGFFLKRFLDEIKLHWRGLFLFYLFAWRWSFNGEFLRKHGF